MTLALRFAARSHTGLLREGNEDSVYAGPRVLAVADGMGGHAAGEVASAVAIAALACLLATAAAWLWMDNLATVTSSPREQMQVVKQRRTWQLSLLYIGTFGSFIGYSAAMPLLIKLNFWVADPAPLGTGIYFAYFAFLGAGIGSVTRPIGGWLADTYGGARVTLPGRIKPLTEFGNDPPAEKRVGRKRQGDGREGDVAGLWHWTCSALPPSGIPEPRLVPPWRVYDEPCVLPRSPGSTDPPPWGWWTFRSLLATGWSSRWPPPGWPSRTSC